MFALVEIAGQQFEVTENTQLNVPRMSGDAGDQVEFTNLLLKKNGSSIELGAPYVSGSVKATILEHGKDKTVLVFHKKRRKGHRKLNGHRAQYTRIQVNSVN